MQKIGILGGGQLARMLVDSAQRLGIPYLVYAQSPSDSVTHVTKNVVFGALEDTKALSSFFDSVQIVTTENEFLDVELMRKAAHGKEIQFRPSLDSIRTAQDKLAQKKLFHSLELPTSAFLVWDDSATSPRAFCEDVLRTFPMGAMLKWSRFGYDGKGNLPFRPSNDASLAEPFFREGLTRGAQIYAEEWVRFENELALVTAVSPLGDLKYFPTVISEQRDSICYKVRGPATQMGVQKKWIEQAQGMAQKIAHQLPFVGCFALEFFFSQDWGLKINEMAPRVHNTGHHSQLSSNKSQFDLHLLAISGQQLPDLHSSSFFGMVNVLGAWPEKELPSAQKNDQPGQIQIYNYNKEPRSRRKLGHVNLVATSLGELELNLNLVESWIR